MDASHQLMSQWQVRSHKRVMVKLDAHLWPTLSNITRKIRVYPPFLLVLLNTLVELMESKLLLAQTAVATLDAPLLLPLTSVKQMEAEASHTLVQLPFQTSPATLETLIATTSYQPPSVDPISSA